jgi:DNA helicase II / ATP-dependent DNA helicase PcrA
MRRFQLEPASEPSSPTEAATILSGLNEAQQSAVATSDGPVLIIAGPGSGKTRTLTHRIAYLLASGKARPSEVLALTFTNKAAREMKERIAHLVGEEQARGMWMGTFHATFARLMRREAEKIGFNSDFSIYDTDDTERILKGLMQQYHVDPKQNSVRSMRGLISSAKNQLVNPVQYQRMAASLAQEKAAMLYGPYEDALRRANAMDFDDLLVRPIELFQKDEETLKRYQQRWRYIHIDEYQDTNHAQYTLARMLAAGHRNLCVVGDDAQSIYAFRGADIGNILSFQRDYKDATTVRLEQNYRSTQRILRLADAVIKINREQLDKTLWTDNPEGEFVVLMEGLSEKDEAQKIERTIRDLHVRAGYLFRDFAVLYRTNAQSRSLEEALRRGGIPYRVVGGVSFYQRKEIKDVLAYLRLVVNPNDTVSIQRVINTPTRGIGQKTQDELVLFARRQGITLWQALERVDEVPIGPRVKAAVEGFRFLVGKHAAKAGQRSADEVARELVKESGILDELRQENTEESLVRWENVQELLNAITEFTLAYTEANSLSAFLQEVSLLTDADANVSDDSQVTLMTLHSSKGLEFPVVFVTGLEEGLFPLGNAAQDLKDLEEERRLLYVGITRAQQKLFLTYARSRFRFGEHESSIRSRFLDEIEVDVIRTEAGGAFTGKKDRFALPKGPSYEAMDPHYYRQNLRAEPAPRSTAAPGGREVVYEEGEGEIVPGVRVDHHLFGEGKVLAMEGTGNQAKAVVHFKSVGQKKLALKFARLRLLG